MARIFLPCLCAVTLCMQVAAAQSATLTSLSSAPTPGGGARVMVQFTPQLPQYTESGDGTSEIQLHFKDADFKPGLSAGSAGPLREVRLQKTADGFTLRLLLTGPNAAGVNRLGNGLLILIAAVAAPAQPPEVTAGRPHTELVMAPGAQADVIVLKYADVSEIAGVLTNSAPAPAEAQQPTRSIFVLPGMQNSGYPADQRVALFVGGLRAQVPPVGERVSGTIAIDRRLNAVILTGLPQERATAKAIIAKLDVPVPSVVLDCQVVELSRSAAADVGVDYNTEGQFASATLVGGTGVPPQARASFAAAVYAEVRNGEGRFLASPRLAAPAGKPVSILSGDALPVFNTQINRGPPLYLIQTVTYVDVGVDVQVQARVAADNTVTAHIFAELSNVSAQREAAAAVVPTITMRQLATTATAREGQAFIIGGFPRTTVLTTRIRTPVLGDLPLIGRLFSVTHRSVQESNLYIIITPHILTPQSA